ncbi:MAG: type II toxin-antitoxin system RelE family toxin [Candidatus Nanopelagicales bacterium]
MTYRINVAPPARRALENDLPEHVAAAARAFITGALADNPQRVGKPLLGELAGFWAARRGQYRVVHAIHEGIVTVTVVRVAHLRDAYR